MSFTRESRRQRNLILLIVGGFGVIVLLIVGTLIGYLIPSGRRSSAPTQQVPTSSSTSGNVGNGTGSDGQQPPQATTNFVLSSSSNTQQSSPPESGEVQQTVLARGGSTQPPLDNSPEVDRYPGSEKLEVDKSKLPDIGIPVASAVYRTSDSVATVIDYYKNRYPDAQLSEMQGQNILAIERNGTAKVIAIGINGNDTRIAIVHPN